MYNFGRIVVGLITALCIIGCGNNSPTGVAFSSNDRVATTTTVPLGPGSYIDALYEYSNLPFVFVSGADQQLYFNMYSSYLGKWHWDYWYQICPGAITGMISCVYSDGEVWIFSRSPYSNQPKYIGLQGGAWNKEWTTGGPQFTGDIIARPQVCNDLGFRVIVKNSADNKLWTITRIGHNWGIWGPIPNSPNIGDKYDLRYMGNSPLSAAGLFCVAVAKFGNGNLCATGYDAFGSKNWTNWVVFSDFTIIGDIAMATNADGRLELFAIKPDRSLWHRYQLDLTYPQSNYPVGKWSYWEQLAGPNTCNGHISTSKNQDGRIEVFIDAYSDGSLKHLYQMAANGVWSGVCNFENGTVQTTKRFACALFPVSQGSGAMLSVYALNPSNTALNYSTQSAANSWWTPFSAMNLTITP